MSDRLDDSAQGSRPDLTLVPDARGQRPRLDGAALGWLLEQLPIGIVGVNRELRIEYLNSAAVAYLDEAVVGEQLPEPRSSFSLRKFAARLFTEASAPHRRVETADGRLFDIDGIPAGIGRPAVLLLVDVTLRERRSRAERDFVSNAAHELRTPIAAIAGAVDVLEAGAKDRPRDRDVFIEHISRESDRLGRLSEALLLLTRLQSDCDLGALELVEVGPVVEEVAGDLDSAEGVELSIACADGLLVLADRDLLRQALLNVGANAVRHTSAGQIELSCRAEGQRCVIEVRDTGPGIPEVEQDHVFDRFYRVRGSGRGGFGLGLAITREIARAFGGTAEIDSKVGEGTRVLVRLPLARVVGR